jgi:hypothetical protein
MAVALLKTFIFILPIAPHAMKRQQGLSSFLTGPQWGSLEEDRASAYGLHPEPQQQVPATAIVAGLLYRIPATMGELLRALLRQTRERAETKLLL